MASASPPPPVPGDDDEGFLIATEGTEILGPRGRVYTIVRELGQGQFGHIFEAILTSSESQESYAIKIQRSAAEFRVLAEHESTMLTLLQQKSTPEEQGHFLQIIESFLFRDHFCIVVELLGMNLLEVLMRRTNPGLPIRLLQIAAKDLFESLVLFKRCQVVHGDLKPENLVICPGEAVHMKVIDFGQARLTTELFDGDLQTLFYRAPEIVLGLRYGFPVDMWSAGCILAELFLSLPLFEAKSEFGLLQKQVNFFGHIPREMSDISVRKKEFFLLTGELKSEAASCDYLGIELPESERYFTEKTLSAIIMKHCRVPDTTIEDIEAEAPARSALVDLLQKIFEFIPERRILPEKALEHEFLTTDFSAS
jgi:dual specificity protein kinase YAK1